ncbi:sulfatase [Flagellimonas algicola]|uniref:Sulfatase n=1 Tax=Flagellimonas algicola TaxID=2583815 RepID=A0ABY2WQ76_9FLAO|nr:sulfatase [Allomuricauda algicola]TMU57133.1 sulfatase [Allomuricauda algicola]
MKNLELLTWASLAVLLITACSSKEQHPKKPNILLICVDDLRPDLKSFGAEHIISPNIDQLARSGMSFYRHYVNAPSCGPSRYTLLTGQYGRADNYALFHRAENWAIDKESVSPSMPEWFRINGYTTVSVGKVSHHPGGRGGKDWNDSSKVEIPNAWDKHLMPASEWIHPRGAMHGLAYGEIRKNATEMDVFQSGEGNDEIYPDGAIANEALKQLRELSNTNEKPFFLAVGFLKPHLPFGAPKSYLEPYVSIKIPRPEHSQKPAGKTTWHGSGEFMKYNRWDKDPNEDQTFAEEVRRHYAACISYVDAQIGKVLQELKKTGADKNTIVVLWGDHGWHLGEHAIWGKHSLFEESLRAPLIVHYPGMDNANANTKAIVETIDIFPTLCELTGVETPSFVQGTSLKPILEDSRTPGHPAVAYTNNAMTLRTNTHRFTLHNDGYTELYDHTTKAAESQNRAMENPGLVDELKKTLEARLPEKHKIVQ